MNPYNTLKPKDYIESWTPKILWERPNNQEIIKNLKRKTLDSKKQDDTFIFFNENKIKTQRTNKNFKMDIQEFQDEDSRLLKETKK